MWRGLPRRATTLMAPPTGPAAPAYRQPNLERRAKYGHDRQRSYCRDQRTTQPMGLHIGSPRIPDRGTEKQRTCRPRERASAGCVASRVGRSNAGDRSLLAAHRVVVERLRLVHRAIRCPATIDIERVERMRNHDELQPYQIKVPDDELADLRDRRSRVRWARCPRCQDSDSPANPDTGWDHSGSPERRPC
jgi:hypothetical protein